ncbi:nuclear transport factor 2 family protein [Agromyces larvae]|uniref:Nuclear transport factor 2 family protein n=1 Tax=Agromyces larvae TaxID=2929802 RepID=A0ABY4BZQ9_9MICO|nr:nuclear transport factor 2 family protein [Agromyces larvae]UOE44394.1 nuclear transport factor 2 family protein [Agromyces larvae]
MTAVATVEDEVRAAVERYVQGVSTNDPALVMRAFSDDAVMWGYLGPEFVTQSAAAFAEQVVATAPAPDPAYASEIHSISVTGEVATAVLDERSYLGADFRNHFGLARIEGAWRIVSKVFTTR